MAALATPQRPLRPLAGSRSTADPAWCHRSNVIAWWLSYSARRDAILAYVGHFPIIVKPKDHDIRVPIFGMGRVVEISRVAEINMTPAVLHEI